MKKLIVLFGVLISFFAYGQYDVMGQFQQYTVNLDNKITVTSTGFEITDKAVKKCFWWKREHMEFYSINVNGDSVFNIVGYLNWVYRADDPNWLQLGIQPEIGNDSTFRLVEAYTDIKPGEVFCVQCWTVEANRPYNFTWSVNGMPNNIKMVQTMPDYNKANKKKMYLNVSNTILELIDWEKK